MREATSHTDIRKLAYERAGSDDASAPWWGTVRHAHRLTRLLQLLLDERLVLVGLGFGLLLLEPIDLCLIRIAAATAACMAMFHRLFGLGRFRLAAASCTERSGTREHERAR